MQAAFLALFLALLRTLLCGALGIGSAVAGNAGTGRLQVAEAEFRSEGVATFQTVPLPDTWVQRGLAAGGVGHYRLRFMLPSAVQPVWGLEARRLSTAHEVRLNGQLVHGSLLATPAVPRAIHTLIALPPHLLRSGENTLEISIGTRTTAGLSPLTLGPMEALEADFRRSQLRHVALPQVANIAAGGVSLFMLLIWWRRRSETVIGSFGALCLLASLRNYGYFVTATPLPSPWSSWLYMQAALLTTLLLGVFAMAFAGQWPAWFRRSLVATGLLFPLLSLWARSADALQTARLWSYPVLLVLVVAALGLLMRAAASQRSLSGSALVVSLAGVLVAAVHDYLFQQGALSIMGSFWVPYAVPVTVAVFSASLLKRLLSSLETVERMNATLERKVAERTRELQAASEAQTRFLAAASHDLRQPMVSIGLLVGLMDEQLGSGPLQRVMQGLKQATGAMENLLTRLLDLSRLQSGTVRVQCQPLALPMLLKAVAAQHAAQAQGKGLQLRVQAFEALVHSDPTLLEQILGNLVGNAVRYTRQGGVLLGVRPAGPAHWRVAVWDTGPGIAADARQAIFGEFVRGAHHASNEEAATGLGLGLAIAQRAAALLGAEVVLRSEPGRGSCFSVVLPRARVAQAPAPAPDRPPALPHPLAGRRLWLLEDDPHARASMVLSLQHWGAEVQAFASLQALRSAAGAWPRPDLLISDLRLADGLGSDALLHLRQRWPAQAAMFVTGNTAPDDLATLERWRAAGVPVLIKPFASASLQATVLAALGAARD